MEAPRRSKDEHDKEEKNEKWEPATSNKGK